MLLFMNQRASVLPFQGVKATDWCIMKMQRTENTGLKLQTLCRKLFKSFFCEFLTDILLAFFRQVFD